MCEQCLNPQTNEDIHSVSEFQKCVACEDAYWHQMLDDLDSKIVYHDSEGNLLPRWM